MGCDMHGVIEFETHEGRVLPFARVWLGRDYRLYAALAGVRATPEERPLFPPRGLPAKRSYVIRDLYFHSVVDDARANDPSLRGEDFVTRSQADAMVNRGAFYTPNAFGVPDSFVSKGDWHTPSWLTLAEIHKALEHAQLRLDECNGEFRAALAAMSELAKGCAPDSVRLVFWFLG